MNHPIVARPYHHINNYGYYGVPKSLPDLPDNIAGIPTKELGEYKAIAEEFAPTIAKLVSGMSPVEQYAQLEARIKVINTSAWRNVPVVGTFLTGRLEEYKARLIALEEEMEDYREIKRKKQLAWTIGVIGAGTLVLFGVTGVIRNIVQATK